VKETSNQVMSHSTVTSYDKLFSHGYNRSIVAACRNHKVACPHQTYGNAEPKSVVNWAPITRVLCCRTCTFYVTRLAKRKRQQLPV